VLPASYPKIGVSTVPTYSTLCGWVSVDTIPASKIPVHSTRRSIRTHSCPFVHGKPPRCPAFGVQLFGVPSSHLFGRLFLHNAKAAGYLVLRSKASSANKKSPNEPILQFPVCFVNTTTYAQKCPKSEFQNEPIFERPLVLVFVRCRFRTWATEVVQYIGNTSTFGVQRSMFDVFCFSSLPFPRSALRPGSWPQPPLSLNSHRHLSIL
jgi:hypothetical protein